MIPVVHHPDYVAPARPGSRYQWNKNGLIRELLRECGRAIDWIEPEPMPRAWLEAVHDPAYVAEVIEGRVPPEKERRIGFPVDAFVSRRAVRVPGGTFAAALIAMERGFAANSAGGSHQVSDHRQFAHRRVGHVTGSVHHPPRLGRPDLVRAGAGQVVQIIEEAAHIRANERLGQ